MDSSADSVKLHAIRLRHQGLNGATFLLGSDDQGEFADAKGSDGSLLPIVRFTRAATVDERDFIINAPDDVGFLLSLLDRAIRKERARLAAERSQAAATPAVKDHTTEAAMLCESPMFQKFLVERHGLDAPVTKDRAAQRLRSVLGITSRKQLNENDAARERWFALRRDFNTWKGRAVA